MKLSNDTKGTAVMLVVFLVVAAFALGYRVCELLG